LTNTLWLTRLSQDLALPHHITVDMAMPRWVGGFSYTPRTDGSSNGIPDQYRFETSQDGTTWITNIATGLFSNLLYHPDPLLTTFSPMSARFFRFTALHEVNSNGWTSAAEISVLPAGFDAWRRDLGLQTNGPNSLDANGIPLLMDYFRGVNPGTVTNASIAATGANQNTLFFDVRRQPGRFDLTQDYQISTNLTSWSSAVGAATNNVTPETDDTETLHLSVPRPDGGPAFFLRLVINQN
jgi:hypothetical protein